MKSRDSLPLIGLVVGVLVGVLVACGVPGDNPLSPSAGSAFGPSSVPYGPSSGPYGPSSKPYGPSSGPYGPSSRPTGPSSNPGGGGGPTPPPAPTPPPTPTPVPSATPPGGNPCPATLTVRDDNQFVTNGGGNGPEISVSGFDPDCIVTSIRVSLHATTQTDLSVHADPVVAFFALGRHIGFDLLEPVAQGLSLSGPSLGSSCANLQFADNGSNFPAGPPYVGTFKPRGDTFEGTLGTFDVFYGEPVNGLWELPFYRLDEPITVQCWRIDFELDRLSP